MTFKGFNVIEQVMHFGISLLGVYANIQGAKVITEIAAFKHPP